jgi:hypothetical protein
MRLLVLSMCVEAVELRGSSILTFETESRQDTLVAHLWGGELIFNIMESLETTCRCLAAVLVRILGGAEIWPISGHFGPPVCECWVTISTNWTLPACAPAPQQSWTTVTPPWSMMATHSALKHPYFDFLLKNTPFFASLPPTHTECSIFPNAIVAHKCIWN